jgi:ketosteroid isomerase-like protein
VIEGISGNQGAGPDNPWPRRPRPEDRRVADNHRAARAFLSAWSCGELPGGLLADGMSAWTTTGKHMERKQYQLGARRLASLFQGGLSSEIRSLTAEEDRATIEAHVHGELASGGRFENFYVFVLRIADGRIVSVAEHFDPEPVRLQIDPLLKGESCA